MSSPRWMTRQPTTADTAAANRRCQRRHRRTTRRRCRQSPRRPDPPRPCRHCHRRVRLLILRSAEARIWGTLCRRQYRAAATAARRSSLPPAASAAATTPPTARFRCAAGRIACRAATPRRCVRARIDPPRRPDPGRRRIAAMSSTPARPPLPLLRHLRGVRDGAAKRRLSREAAGVPPRRQGVGRAEGRRRRWGSGSKSPTLGRR